VNEDSLINNHCIYWWLSWSHGGARSPWPRKLIDSGSARRRIVSDAGFGGAARRTSSQMLNVCGWRVREEREEMCVCESGFGKADVQL